MRPKVILIHPNDHAIQTVTERLTAYGYLILGVGASVEEAFVLCRSCSPDVLIMRESLIADGCADLLKRLETELPSPPVTILFSPRTITPVVNTFYNCGGDAVVFDPVDYGLCNEYITQFLRLHRHRRSPLFPSSEYRGCAKKLLTMMQMPTKLCGYIYILDAIDFLAQDPSLASNLIDGLYTLIGDLYQEPYTNIERCIRTAVERTFQSGDLYCLLRFFSDAICEQTGKPKNGDFLKGLYDIIRQELSNPTNFPLG